MEDYKICTGLLHVLLSMIDLHVCEQGECSCLFISFYLLLVMLLFGNKLLKSLTTVLNNFRSSICSFAAVVFVWFLES